VLPEDRALDRVNVKDGDLLSAVVGKDQLASTDKAFALLGADGSVVAWGHPDSGGDARALQHRLSDVEMLQGSFRAFAALKADGSVVTWGHRGYGGQSIRDGSQGHSESVKRLFPTHNGILAVLVDGSVAPCGWSNTSEDVTTRRAVDCMTGVQDVKNTRGAFAAIVGDGSVVTGGNYIYGGDCSAVREQLQDVRQIAASYGAFAARRGDGS
ncbi:pim1, partial [Symbiodinium pilosum]